MIFHIQYYIFYITYSLFYYSIFYFQFKVRLWDPKQESPVCSLFGHKKQVNVCSWNKNGNWLASGSKDGLIKIYDIRTMKEIEVFRGQMSDICSLGWHPQHESLLLSGTFFLKYILNILILLLL